MRPLVAPLVGAEGSPLARCMRQQLEDSGRFRLVAAEAIKGLLEKPPRSRLAALSAGKTLGAEIVAYVEGQEDGKARAALVDVLTGEVPIKLALAAGPLGCKPIVAEMVRVLLGEGRVTAVKGERTTVNLGWKSRVAPGLVLLLERDGRPAGSLTVERVEMDRCTARGHARVGDIVRLPR